jgi:hypothetical protein
LGVEGKRRSVEDEEIAKLVDQPSQKSDEIGITEEN